MVFKQPVANNSHRAKAIINAFYSSRHSTELLLSRVLNTCWKPRHKVLVGISAAKSNILLIASLIQFLSCWTDDTCAVQRKLRPSSPCPAVCCGRRLQDDCVSKDVTNLHCNLSASLLPLSIDVTEVQIFIIIMYLLAAVGGSAFWQSLVILICSNCYRLKLKRLIP